jgi:hypothetical protein
MSAAMRGPRRSHYAPRNLHVDGYKVERNVTRHRKLFAAKNALTLDKAGTCERRRGRPGLVVATWRRPSCQLSAISFQPALVRMRSTTNQQNDAATREAECSQFSLGFPLSDVRCPTSDFRLPTSDFQPPIGTASLLPRGMFGAPDARNHAAPGDVCGAHQTGSAPAGAHRSWDPRGQFLVRACPRMARRAPMGQGRMRNAECKMQSGEQTASRRVREPGYSEAAPVMCNSKRTTDKLPRQCTGFPPARE